MHVRLCVGIRHLDIRLAARQDTEELFCVHGLYGPNIESCLDELQAFLAQHPKEVVILDFRYFPSKSYSVFFVIFC